MSRYKTTTNYYLDKDKFSAIKMENLWETLSNHIASSASSFDKIETDRSAFKMKVTSKNIASLSDLVKLPDSEPSLDKSVIRTCKLNTTFNKETGSLMISNENADEDTFPGYNEVAYQILCNDGLDYQNALFFHESALVDYTKDENKEDFISNTNVLAMITYDETIVKTDSNANQTTNNFVGTAFLCYDTATRKLKEDQLYPTLNEGCDLNLSNFIELFNSGNVTPIEQYTEVNRESISAFFVDFKIGISLFKMSDEHDFINFKSFVPSPIYNNFIDNLKKKLETI